MTAAAIILTLFLVASLARNRQLRHRIDGLKLESARALEDDGLMAQLETAAALGSPLATRLLNGETGTEKKVLCGQSGQVAAFETDFAACKEPGERWEVFVRWHKKGMRLPLKRRAQLLDGAMNKETRDSYRKCFDEQDERQTQPPATPA